MTIVCTKQEQLEMEHILAIAHGCLCTPDERESDDCRKCHINTIEWAIKDGDGE